LRQIDAGLYPVWHEYRTLWDSIINRDAGELEDPRYVVNRAYGALNFGYVLTDGEGAPIYEGRWHIWRWCDPHGLAHIVPLLSTEPEYLELIIKRLHLQAQWTNMYGFRSYNKLMDSVAEEHRTQMMKDRQALFEATQDENKWLMNRAMDNFASGRTAPTNPEKDSIISFPGQTNHSRTIRPLDDEEGGLIVPGV
jgi:hypothetical protein